MVIITNLDIFIGIDSYKILKHTQKIWRVQNVLFQDRLHFLISFVMIILDFILTDYWLS